MSTWRDKALEVLPAQREVIEEAESPMALWIDLCFEFETAAKRNENDTVRRILDYAFWSGFRPLSSSLSSHFLSPPEVDQLEAVFYDKGHS